MHLFNWKKIFGDALTNKGNSGGKEPKADERRTEENNSANEQLDDINLDDEDEDEDDDGIINFWDWESIQLDDDRGWNSAPGPGNDVINLNSDNEEKATMLRWSIFVHWLLGLLQYWFIWLKCGL